MTPEDAARILRAGVEGVSAFGRNGGPVEALRMALAAMAAAAEAIEAPQPLTVDARVTAALNLHERKQVGEVGVPFCRCDGEDWPCRTARALGVTT